MASELASHKVVETIPPVQVFPPLPDGQSFQDLPSSDDDDDDDGGTSDADDDDDDEETNAIIAAAEAAFTQNEAEYMLHFLKERGLFAFVKKYVQEEDMPIPRILLAFGVLIPPETTFENQIRMLKITCSRVLRNREKLEQYNTVDDAVELIRRSKRIVLLTGAGVSTSCGIPDFRSPTGLYARLKEEHWELDDPQQMFDLPYFKEKPNVFYSFAKEIYPSNFVPSPCHRFVKMLENKERLLRNYTQNIDGLFEAIGVGKLLNCHGSFATASCLRCRTKFPGSAIEADVFAQRVPLCPLCSAHDQELVKQAPPPPKVPERWRNDGRGFEDEDEDRLAPPSEWEGKPLVKPDIVFFGEMLSDEFDRCLLNDREEVDLLIVIGTSLRVAPVSQLVSHIPHSVPQILINRDPVSHHTFDIALLGDGDTIVQHLVRKLGETDWPLPLPAQLQGQPAPVGNDAAVEPERVADSHVWLFPGANKEHRWIELVRQAYEDSDDDEAQGGGDVRELKPIEGASLPAGVPDDLPKRTMAVPASLPGSRSRSRSPAGLERDSSDGKKPRMQ